ncbi:MAG: cytochrome ubiquinol oxidase subunit I, partial [Chitinophagaceae bacterium]|nr:cytochrome ubiquinol oxidase subunit I [Chitinophagaceae bacterium]
LVVAANSWMNSPTGFDFADGKYTNIDPIQAMFNDAWFSQSLHMTLAAFAATGFAVAGIHALMILRKKNVAFHTGAFRIAAVFGIVAALLQPLSGDLSAKEVAIRQPAKLAAMEAHFHTEKPASLIIGGIPDEKTKTVNYAIRLPGMLSFLAHGDFESEVIGLDQIPEDQHPPVLVTHLAFQTMVGIGSLLVLMAIVYIIAVVKKKSWFNRRWFLKMFAIATPLGFIAVEAGWTVTEVGRQPWIIYGVMKTADAVTPMPGIVYSFYLYTAIYISLALIVAFILIRQIMMVNRLYDLPEKQPPHA